MEILLEGVIIFFNVKYNQFIAHDMCNFFSENALYKIYSKYYVT